MTIYYFDPSATFNGDGLAPTPAASGGASGAYNVRPTITAGNTYRLKRGTTYTVATPASNSGLTVLSLVATAATPTTIEAYYNDDGTDDPSQPLPIIDHNGGGSGQACIRVQSSQYVVVRNIRGVNSILASGACVRVRNSSDVSITGCIGNNSQNGFNVAQDTAAAVMSNITIDSCEAYGNVAGILFLWMDSTGSIIKDLTISNNKVYNNRTVDITRPGGIVHGYTGSSTTITDTDRGTQGIWIVGNECYGNRGYPISIYGASSSTRQSIIKRNHVHHNNPDADVDNHCIWAGACRDTLIEENEVNNNNGFAGGTGGSCVGIFVDYNLSNTAVVGARNVVRRNKIYNGWFGNTLVTKGASFGVYVLNNQNCIIEANLIYNCRGGIIVARDTVVSPAHIIQNNTIVGMVNDNGFSGSGILLDVGNDHVVRNNIIKDCSLEGLFINSSLTGVVETNNAVYNANVAKVVSADFLTLTPGTLDASDITADPLLDANLFISSVSSPAYRTGNHAGYKADRLGNQRWNPPSIGAYEYVEARPSRF